MSEQKNWSLELRNKINGNIEGYDKVTGTYADAKEYAIEWLQEFDFCEIVIIDEETEETVYQGTF